MKSLISRAGDELRTLTAWWVGEIADLSTALLVRFNPVRSETVVLCPEERRFRLWVTDGKAASDEVCIEIDGTGQWPEDPLGQEQLQMRSRRVTLLIPERQTLTCVVRVPLAAERNLAAVVALAMERELPLPLEQLATEWRVVRREPAWLHVQINALQSSRLRAIQEQAEGWGLHVSRSAIAPPDFDGRDLRRAYGNLGAQKKRTRATAPWTRLQRRLAWGSAASVLLAVLVTAGQWIHERVRVHGALREARDASALLDSVRREYQGKSAPAIELAGSLRSGDALSALARLTQSVPGDSWAFDVSIQDDPEGGYVVRFSGRAPSGPDLIEQLKQNPELDDVTLVSSQPAEFGMSKGLVTVSLRWKGSS